MLIDQPESINALTYTLPIQICTKGWMWSLYFVLSQPYVGPFDPLKAIETISGQDAKAETVKALDVLH